MTGMLGIVKEVGQTILLAIIIKVQSEFTAVVGLDVPDGVPSPATLICGEVRKESCLVHARRGIMASQLTVLLRRRNDVTATKAFSG